jgi:hypothetical protein
MSYGRGFSMAWKKVRRRRPSRRRSWLRRWKNIDNTGWWTHTRWQLHFGDRHLGNIAHASRLPDRKELELDAKGIVISMIKRAVDGLSLLHDDTPH